MHHIDYGLGVFRREAFADVPDGARLDLAQLYQNPAGQRATGGL